MCWGGLVGWGRQDVRGQMEEKRDEMGSKVGLWGGTSQLSRISSGQSQMEGPVGLLSEATSREERDR